MEIEKMLNDEEQLSYERFTQRCVKLNRERSIPFSNLKFTVIASPTGIGTNFKAICEELEITKDITDYDSW